MNTQDIIALIVVYGIIIVALALSIIAEKKQWKFDTRKIVHIGVGNFIFVWWAFSESWIMEVFFAIPFTIILFFAMFPNNPIGKSKLGELTQAQGNRTGLFFYAISIGLLAYFCFGEHWLAASIAVVAMTYGDGFGSIIGKKFGKHKTIHGKSLEGSLGVFAATTIVSLIVWAFYSFITDQGWYAGANLVAIIHPVLACMLAGLVTSVVETLAPGDVDNLLNPLITAGVMILIGL